MIFRFGAAAALDLQRKREDEARVALVRAEAAVEAAELRVAQAGRWLDEDGLRLVDVQRGGAPAWLIAWHRSWMVRRRLECDACRTILASHRETASAAAAAVREAHRRRRTLERLRDRAWRKFQIERDRLDLQQMNELAGLRHVARAAAEGETYGEHQHRPDGQQSGYEHERV